MGQLRSNEQDTGIRVEEEIKHQYIDCPDKNNCLLRFLPLQLLPSSKPKHLAFAVVIGIDPVFFSDYSQEGKAI